MVVINRILPRLDSIEFKKFFGLRNLFEKDIRGLKGWKGFPRSLRAFGTLKNTAYGPLLTF